jgi:hypothetical protein
MMARFYGYIDKVFRFRELASRQLDSRRKPLIPTAAVFGTAFAMFATCRGSLNGIDKERHFPGRLRNLVGPQVPSGDTVGRVYAQLDSEILRGTLRDVHLRIKRNKMLDQSAGWWFAAVDGHEFFRQPQAVLRAVPDAQLRERIAGAWKERAQTSSWCWATTFPRRLLPTRSLWRAGHWRWHIENGCFNDLSTHWGLDHVFKHAPTAIVNFILTLFLAFTLLQCFWQRNLKPPFRDRFTLIGLAAELYAALVRARHGRGARVPRARAP